MQCLTVTGLDVPTLRVRPFAMWHHSSVTALTDVTGAVPVVTLNLQQGVKGDRLIPDSWHHQMVYGVGPEGVIFTRFLLCSFEPV